MAEITNGDDGDLVTIRVSKNSYTENTVILDYIELVYLGDGKDGPVDLAHAALREATVTRQPAYT